MWRSPGVVLPAALLAGLAVGLATGRSAAQAINPLPPGEHILLLDEKTIPELTRSVTGSQTIKVAAGNETSSLFPVTPVPAQIKKFPR